ncbi:MAG: hypothetical protein IJV77_07580 [Clostridia bacterium]|nr:hypothetical protein [Clostridia bacterium]
MKKDNSQVDTEDFKKELAEAERLDRERYKIFLFSKKHKKEIMFFNVVYFIFMFFITRIIDKEIFMLFIVPFLIYIVAFSLSMLRKEKYNSGRGFLIAYTALSSSFLLPVLASIMMVI